MNSRLNTLDPTARSPGAKPANQQEDKWAQISKFNHLLYEKDEQDKKNKIMQQRVLIKKQLDDQIKEKKKFKQKERDLEKKFED